MDRFHSFLQEGSGEESATHQPEPQQTKSQPCSEKTDIANKLPKLEGSSDKKFAKQTDDSKRVEGLKKKKVMRIEKQLAKSRASKLEMWEKMSNKHGQKTTHCKCIGAFSQTQ